MGRKKAKNSNRGGLAKRLESPIRKGFTFQKRLLLLLLPLVIIITYSHTLHSPFVFDDIANISANPAARASDLNFENMRKAAVDSPISTRPVSYITFAVNYFFHKHEVYGYRLVNLVIHVLNGVLLYLFLMNTFKLPILQGRIKQPFWVAYCAALIWVIHPLQVQSDG